MKILALDTSGPSCSVALSTSEQEIRVMEELAPRQHAARIIPLIHELLEQENISLSQLDAIAFSCGPGSFTGIRLAASLTQGLAFSSNLPVIPISSLQILAQGAYTESKIDKILVANDAFAESIYWGVYENNDGIMQPIIPDQRSKPEALKVQEQDVLLGVGNAWDKYPDKISFPIKGISQGSFNARDMVPLAFFSFKNNRLFPAKDALPNYLYAADCWKKV